MLGLITITPCTRSLTTSTYLFVLTTTKPFYLARYLKLRDYLDAKIKDQPNIVQIEEEEDRLGQAVEKNSVDRLNKMLCQRARISKAG